MNVAPGQIAILSTHIYTLAHTFYSQTKYPKYFLLKQLLIQVFSPFKYIKNPVDGSSYILYVTQVWLHSRLWLKRLKV